MEVHHHVHPAEGGAHTSPDSHRGSSKKKWTHYLWEFLMLFLAVFCGFLAEYQLEHKIERDRSRQFLQSMLVDVSTNIVILDSLMTQNQIIVANHDSLVNWLLMDSVSVDRAAFAKKMGPVWIRNYYVRKETYDQMKASGALRYVGKIQFIKKLMEYERINNFAQSRNEQFERKYYTELFIPALYKNYDLGCQIGLDPSNYSDPVKMEKMARHNDVLKGNDAVVFRHDMGAALTLRLERLRRSLDAYRDAKTACVEMEKLIKDKLGIR